MQQALFWPSVAETQLPIGGSFLAIRTKDSRLYLYQYISANPNHWSEVFEVSHVVRNYKLEQFQSEPVFERAQTESELSDDVGERVFNFVQGLRLRDFCFCPTADEKTLNLVLLYDDGSVYKVVCDFSSGSAVVQFATAVCSSSTDAIHRLPRPAGSTEMFLITCQNGSLIELHLDSSGFSLGKSLSMSAKRVTQCSSVCLQGETIVFLTRQNSIEKLVFGSGTGAGYTEGSRHVLETDNVLPFVACRAFVNVGKVQCTAVSQCGDVTFVEMNARGQIYSRYSDEVYESIIMTCKL